MKTRISRPSEAMVTKSDRYHQPYPANRHFARVYATRNPCRSALLCDSLPASATIIARSHQCSNALPHARLQQRGLQSTAAQSREPCRPRKQRYALMQIDNTAAAARLPFKLGQKARTLFARQRNGAHCPEEIRQFGMFVRPTAGADVVQSVASSEPVTRT